MFIKTTRKTDPKTGKAYFSYHLIESVRTKRGPRQRILLYMGSEIDLPVNEHKLLAQRIEEIITRQQSLFPCSNSVEQLAQIFAAQVITRLSERQKGSDNAKTEQHFVNLDVNSIKTSKPRTVGAEHLLLQMANQLQLSKKLKELGFSETEVANALGTIIARAIYPDSEKATYERLCDKSGLGELLDFDFEKSSLNHLYRISDKLLMHKNELETYLERTEKDFHGYQSTIALYDLTNTYMEGQAKSNPKAAHGVSKERRSDCPLVTMGLVMNEHGFLNRTSILPGNASEPKTLEKMIESLKDHQNLFKPTILLDAGIATVANLKWLRENNYPYVVSARQNAPSMELEGELVSVGDVNNLVKAALIKGDHGDEKWLYCESEAKAAVASEMKVSFKKRFEEDLEKLADGLIKPKGRKKYVKVLERLGRLKEKHKRISACYEVEVIASEDGLTATSIKWKVIDEKMSEKLTGKYFLRSYLVDRGPKELWKLYNILSGVEDAFRFMKSSLGLRPVYHQKEHRVDGHLWITILAYHLIQHCLYQLGQREIRQNWNTILETLLNRSRVTVEAATKDGKTLYHRSTTVAEEKQIAIYKALGLSPQILQSTKIFL